MILGHYVYVVSIGLSPVYVGYTYSPNKRRQEHRRRWPTGNYIVVGKYPTEIAGLEAEQWWMARLRAKGFLLENRRAGGTWRPRVSPSEETRDKIAGALRGKPKPWLHVPCSREKRDKISATLLGRPSPLKGRARSAADRARISAGKLAGWARRKAPRDAI